MRGSPATVVRRCATAGPVMATDVRPCVVEHRRAAARMRWSRAVAVPERKEPSMARSAAVLVAALMLVIPGVAQAHDVHEAHPNAACVAPGLGTADVTFALSQD